MAGLFRLHAITLIGKRMAKPNRRAKRVLDLIICVFAFPFALPLGGLISLLIWLDSPGAPIYRQTRIGKDGRRFTLYKFRTMTHNADRQLKEYLKANPVLADEWKRTQKLQEDPRVTKLGHLLRRTSLDELPQFINVLIGNMSMIGPRPIVESEICRYGKLFREYCDMTPGLTGLWQVSGRSDTTYERRLACDHYYANNWTLWLDLKILAKTIPTALKGFGAY